MGRRRKRQRQVEDIHIHGIADKGLSVGRKDEEVFFVENAVPGDVVDVIVTRKKKGALFSKVTNYKSLSSERVDPQCAHFGVCGGCKWQHLDYGAQLKYKQEVVHSALTRIGKVSTETFIPILGCDEIYEYRNKIEYSFSNKRWLTEEEVASGEDFTERQALGFHRPGAFDKVVDVQKCHLQPSISNDLRNWIRDYAIQNDLSFYDIRGNAGDLRNMYVRINLEGEVMFIMVFGSKLDEPKKKFLSLVEEQFPKITSLFYIENMKANSSIQDLPVHHFSGRETLTETLNHVKFEIGPKSFFQTNTKQAVKLYDIVKDFCGLTGDQNVYDLYTGLGSIASYVASGARQVVAIEEVEAAIEDAKFNAKANNIKNMVFYAGDVKHILTPEFVAQHGAADVIITDPPRAGMHEDVVNMLLTMAAPRIVYVSCNPATQARDLKLMSDMYDVKKIQPVDMFPHTHHIENIALLEKKS